jgi:hypothetical protein
MTKPEASRKSLGFAEAVSKHLGPELTIHGFVCREATPNVARFESPAVLLAITHETFSYELEATFVRKADPSRQYTLRDMLAAFGPSHEEFHGFQAASPTNVGATVRIIADFLKRYGQRILAGDALAYEEMSKAAELRAETVTKHYAQDPIRNDADRAWHRHDYARVRDLYASIESDLTPLEKRRLEYARKHARPPD